MEREGGAVRSREGLTLSLVKQQSIWVRKVVMMTSVHTATRIIRRNTRNRESPSLVNCVQPSCEERWMEKMDREGKTEYHKE